MSDKTKVVIKFTATAEFEVDHGNLNSKDYDLLEPDELREAVEDYVREKAMPSWYYSDYFPPYQIISINDVDADFKILEGATIYIGEAEIEEMDL